jgi:hypothetical protein
VACSHSTNLERPVTPNQAYKTSIRRTRLWVCLSECGVEGLTNPALARTGFLATSLLSFAPIARPWVLVLDAHNPCPRSKCNMEFLTMARRGFSTPTTSVLTSNARRRGSLTPNVKRLGPRQISTPVPRFNREIALDNFHPISPQT